MATIQNIPKLRFPRFEGQWKETLLKDVAEFSKGKGISKSDIVENGTLECIRYGELYTTYNEIIQNIVSKTDLPLKGLELSEYNDVIIPASGETQLDIATASCVLKSGVALSGDLNIIRSSLNGIFLSFYLNNKKKLEIAKLAQGSSVVHLYSSQLKTLKLNIPTLPEQQKIASFLSAVDEKTQQLSRKKELLVQYKKGVMQQLFSGKLRFKDENGKDYPDWEEKKLSDVAEKRIVKNKDNKINLVFTNSAVKGIVNQRDFFDKDIANQSNLLGYYIVEKNDFVYNPRVSSTAPVGPISRNHLDVGIMSPLYSVFRFKNGNLDFIEFFFNSVAWHKHMKDISNYGARDDRMSFSTGDFYKMSIPFPCFEEQQKIANFLSGIDVIIENTNQEINQMQNFKKGLLQQMFV